MALSTSPANIEDLRDEILLHEGFYQSLEGELDSQAERNRILDTLKNLKSQLREMQPPPPQQQPLPIWGDAVNDSSETSNYERSNSSNSSAAVDRMHDPSSDAMGVSSRKRERVDDIHLDVPFAKSRKATPQPQNLSRSSSVDSFKFFDDFKLQDSVVDSWKQKDNKRTKDWLDDLEAKKVQMAQDEEFARQLQEKWDNETRTQPSASQSFSASANPVSSYSQSYMKPNGSWQKPTHLSDPAGVKEEYRSQSTPFGSRVPLSQPVASRIKTEYQPQNISSGSITPLSDSSSGFEEISANDWNRQLSSLFNPPPPRQQDFNTRSMSGMPGSFPDRLYIPPFGGPSSSMYTNTFKPFASQNNAYGYRTMGVPRPGDTVYGTLGTRDSPFDVENMLIRPSFNDDDDPLHTQEDIKDLLKHIRPDEELTEEQQREVQPDGLKIDLMPHQRKGFAWLKSMEEGTNKGGILADDMGLGKTVQALALILGRPPETRGKHPTLVVAPVALMQQWEREIKKFVKPSHALKVIILHQENRNKKWSDICHYDIVLTTYGTLSSDLKRKIIWDNHLKHNPNARPKPQQECPVLGDASHFHRIILDEAQNIKNKNTKAANAACRIKATYRWCLSGTPMQNNVDEIYSLIKFCNIRPYHNYDKFACEIGRPLKRSSDYGKERAMQQLQAILKAILLRRTKDSKIDGQPIIQLPPKNTIEDRAIFSKDELDFYKQLEQQAQIQFNKYLKQGTIGRYYSHALVLLLRLRQCCCSPQLVTNAKEFLTSGSLGEVDYLGNAKSLSKDVLRRLDDTEAYDCPICFDAVENPVIFVPCGHTTCNECLQNMADKAMTDTQAKLNCPHCRAEINIEKVTDLESYLRVYHPDRPGVRSLDANDDDSGSDSDSDSDSDTIADASEDEMEDEDEEDDGGDLKDFIVADDEDVDYKSDSDSLPDIDSIVKAEKKVKQEQGISKINTASETVAMKVESLHETKETLDDTKDKKLSIRRKSSQKAKKEKGRSSKSKGKAKAKNKHISLAELRKEGLKNKAAKKRYLRRLEKGFHTTAKIEKTLELLQEIKDRGLGEKTIIFSSFTSFLDLLEVPLHRDIELSGYTRYDGSMKASDRNNAVIQFTDNPHCKVILVSLKAGNAGLNLTAANHVILLDPFWNPFVEYQAADRCYRIGQSREVTIHRVLIGESEEANRRTDEEQDFTVEDRILRLQDKKRKLVETALDEKAASSLGRLTTRDLGFLFGVNSLD